MKRKLTGKLAEIARKKPALFEELNRKLLTWEYEPLAEWLFESGFKAMWNGAADPLAACVQALTRYRGGHWKDWASSDAQRTEGYRKAEKHFVDAREQAKFSTPEARLGSAVQAKTIAVEALDRLLKSNADPKDISLALRGVVAAIGAEQSEVVIGQKGISIEQMNEKLKLEREKFQFEAAKAALAHVAELKSIAADRSLDNKERIAAVRKRLFGEVAE